ncbi:MAG TPA: TetR/AcrR family transcriptional regulator [Candidatus Binataceae bacterium]|nr:TetR/AcrR family transcriptional regulator [Candidatus Binataceae bacterium]
MKKQSARTASAARTRNRLLSSAEDLFRSQGFHGTGLDQILKRSRTPKGSLYHYFPGGKNELAIATVRYTAALMKQSMTAMLASNTESAAALEAWIGNNAAMLSDSDFRNGCPLAAITLDIASSQPAIREACAQGFQILLDLLSEHLKVAGFSPARARALATLVFASLEGALILSRAQKSLEPLATIEHELAMLIRSSIKAHA